MGSLHENDRRSAGRRTQPAFSNVPPLTKMLPRQRLPSKGERLHELANVEGETL
jgi:hypothetical protein